MLEHRTDCGGNCASCGGCGNVADGGACAGCTGGGTLYLTVGELDLLRRFGEIPFWPVCRAAGGEEPVSPDGMDAALLSALALKGLIRLDYDLPLTNYDYGAFASLPHRGSMALTAAGQAAVELLEIRGAEE